MILAAAGCGGSDETIAERETTQPAEPSEQEIQDGVRESARAAAELGIRRYGLSNEMGDCMESEIVKKAAGAENIAELDQTERQALAIRLGSEATTACSSRDIPFVADDVSRKQAKALVDFQEVFLSQGLASGGFPDEAIPCAIQKMRADVPPSDVAALLNDEPLPDTLVAAVRGCLPTP